MTYPPRAWLAFRPSAARSCAGGRYLGRTVDLRSRLPSTLAPLWRVVHARLSSGRPVSRVRVGPLDADQRSAVADLLGMARLPGEHTTVSVQVLDRILRESLGVGVHEVVTELVGPVGDQAADRRRAATERDELWSWLEGHPVVAMQPALSDWVAAVRRAGLSGGSVTLTREDLERALKVLAVLPASGIPLPVLAEQTLLDTHALDDGTRCSGLVLRALAAIYDRPSPVDASERRALWEQAGITDDELSSVVLAGGMRVDGDSVVGGVLRLCADAGQPSSLTLRQIRASELTSVPERVWVFENPSMLALALNRFGAACPPIVVTSGWPSSAGVLFLRKLAAAGCELHYHGDFDGEGLRIAAHVIARTGARPWRMSSGDYLAAVADGPPVGRTTPVPWDDELAEHLTRMGTTVSEERVATTLLDELTQRHPA
ncbi:TIGR02679 family protein [Saccharopolyspora erythraea]|uniref:TIGR02679 family protein n=1 Tax=Saccharopolyspora erythraea TaxID=1836 RepID=UPI003D801C6D